MDKLAEKIAELSDKYGSHTIEVMRGAARVEAYSTLMSGGMMLVLGLAFLGGAGFMYRLGCKIRDSDDSYYDGEGQFIICGVLTLISAGPLLAGIWCFIDPWVYATISNPDLWIAKKVLGL